VRVERAVDFNKFVLVTVDISARANRGRDVVERLRSADGLTIARMAVQSREEVDPNATVKLVASVGAFVGALGIAWLVTKRIQGPAGGKRASGIARKYRSIAETPEKDDSAVSSEGTFEGTQLKSYVPEMAPQEETV
jgi:hypothetical protein